MDFATLLAMGTTLPVTLDAMTKMAAAIIGTSGFLMDRSDQSTELYDLLRQTDIVATMRMTSGLIKDVMGMKVVSHALEAALINLNDIFVLVHGEVAALQGIFLSHTQKWFYSYRTPDFSVSAERLRQHIQTLHLRLDLVMKLYSTATPTREEDKPVPAKGMDDCSQDAHDDYSSVFEDLLHNISTFYGFSNIKT